MATLIREVWERTLGLVREKQFRVSYESLKRLRLWSGQKRSPREHRGLVLLKIHLYEEKKEEKN